MQNASRSDTNRPPASADTPLSDMQLRQLMALVEGMDAHQLGWLQGYLCGLTFGASSRPHGHRSGPEAPDVTLLYGTETGNSRRAAEIAAEAARARGFGVRVADMREFGRTEWKHVRTLLVAVSTHGEGEPPDSAREVYDLLHGNRAPLLTGVGFSVLALGDSTYEHFCQTGRDVDRRLEALGGRRLHPRVDCDLDFEDAAARWAGSVLDGVARPSNGAVRAIVPAADTAPPPPPRYSRANPFHAEILDNVQLSGHGSEKRVHHLELSVEGAELHHEPGDALWVLPQNAPGDVAELLQALGATGDETVTIAGEDLPLAQALRDRYEITRVAPGFLSRYAEFTGAEALHALLAPSAKRRLAGFAHGRFVADVVREFPAAGVPLADLVTALRPLAPRAYSIASSPRATPDEVHLTVGLARYQARGGEQRGVASGWLSSKSADDGLIPVYLAPNAQFRLPPDPSVPIIMVGPGTGIAPFRGFLAERREQGAPGRNWLFFGDRHLRTDFLYQREWLSLRKEGVLHRLDVAWSRDGAAKTYVQDRIRENGRDLYDWLEHGAHVYVCGDGSRMAPDVHRALRDVVGECRNVAEEEADAYLRTLSNQNRYHRDVY